jgi:hypothetical protein
MKLIKFYDHRLKKDFWLNPEFVLSVRQEQGQWGNTPSAAAIEFKGNAGYGNHAIYVTESCELVAEMLAGKLEMDAEAAAKRIKFLEGEVEKLASHFRLCGFTYP